MRINKILNRLNEQFYKGVKLSGFYPKGNYFEIFKNPSWEEIEEVAWNEDFNDYFIRFVALPDRQDLYIWGSEALHSSMDIYLPVSTNEIYEKGFYNHGTIVNDYIRVDYEDLDDIILKDRIRICNEILEGDYDWLKRYEFDIDYMKKSAKRVLERVDK